MKNIYKEAKDLIEKYSRQLSKLGYSISSLKENQYNFEVVVKENNEKVNLLVYFGKKGTKVVIQGNKESKIYRKIYNEIFGDSLFSDEVIEFKEPENYIGTDESGKGDYFGPLVIAGVYADKENIIKLKSIGVKDSKEIPEKIIRNLSNQIKSIVKDDYSVISISPQKYNELYLKIGNVNRILGWAHAKVLENILGKRESYEAISDKFGDENYIKISLQSRGKNLKLHQQTKAERFTAVAAASILARNKFLEWFDIQHKKMDITIPKGASLLVEETAKKIKEKYGEEILFTLVKMHFKTTRKIVE